MSQQEFFRQSDDADRGQQAPFYRVSGTNSGGRKGGVPKDVPVEDDDFAMPRGYRAQEYGAQGIQEHEQFAPASSENARSGHGVPSWARPQKNNSRGVLLALLIIAGLLLIKPILIVGGILLAVLGATIGVILFGVIFVLAILAIGALFALLALRLTFGRAFQPRRFYDSRYWRRYRRGLRW